MTSPKPRPRPRLNPSRAASGAAAYWAQGWELRALDRLRFHGLWAPCTEKGSRP